LVIAAVLGVLAVCGPALAFSGAGSGTEADPYVITDIYQLQEMQNDLAAYYVLGNDIDASDTISLNDGAGFEPVGTFTGIFDGQGHTITGIYINRPTTKPIGLLGDIGNGAEIKNVDLADADVTGYASVGSLVGYNNDSTVFRCSSSGNVRGIESGGINSRVGGLVGINTNGALISQCYSTANVTSGAWQVGGLTGYNGHGAIVIDCYARGDVSGRHKVGGLVGDNLYPEGGYVQRCYSTGKISGGGGGLIGYNWPGGVTYDSYWDTQTSGKSSSYGGIPKTTEQMMQQGTFVGWDFVEVCDIVENETYPFLRPTLKPVPVAVDIKPGSCPNPLNLAGRGILPVAVLGSQDFDVGTIDRGSIFLDGISPIRTSYEDVASPVTDGSECECAVDGPDGYVDLTLKFRTQEVVEELIVRPGELEKDQTLVLTLAGELFDNTGIEGTDCVVLVGNVPKALAARRLDYNKDGIVNILDFAAMAEYWLESTAY